MALVRAGVADGEIAMASTAVFQDGDATFRWSCLPQGAYRLEVLSPALARLNARAQPLAGCVSGHDSRRPRHR